MYALVIQHRFGVERIDFATCDEAVEAAESTDPMRDGSIYPNIDREVIRDMESKGAEYEQGIFWGTTNRYAVVFNLNPLT